jgi:hypothetical protein
MRQSRQPTRARNTRVPGSGRCNRAGSISAALAMAASAQAAPTEPRAGRPRNTAKLQRPLANACPQARVPGFTAGLKVEAADGRRGLADAAHAGNACATSLAAGAAVVGIVGDVDAAAAADGSRVVAEAASHAAVPHGDVALVRPANAQADRLGSGLGTLAQAQAGQQRASQQASEAYKNGAARHTRSQHLGQFIETVRHTSAFWSESGRPLKSENAPVGRGPTSRQVRV